MVLLLSFLLSVTFADFGFFEEVPELEGFNVKEKIFKIYTPSGQYSSLPPENYETFLSGVEGLFENGSIDKIQLKALIFQVDYCKINDLDPCFLFADIVKATAFTAGSKGDVWTAFHNVNLATVSAVGTLLQKYQKADGETLQKILREARFPVYLVSETGELIVEPDFKKRNWAQNLFFPIENIKSTYDNKDIPAELDYLKFQIPSLQIKPLSISTNSIAGEKVFVGGYPMNTYGKKKRFAGLDSDGKSFYFGRGKVLDVEQFFLRIGVDIAKAKISEEKILQRQKQIKTSVDAAPGHSGGPFMNSNGEVIGILAEYLPIWEPTPSSNTAYGPSFSSILEQ